MTMQASAYGRLGQDPRPIATSTGKTMVVASVAVDAGRGESTDSPPLWLGVVAFGRVAEELARHGKGDLISVSGRVQRNDWTGKDGTRHEQLQIVADSLVSARTVRPGGRRKASGSTNTKASARTGSSDGLPFDDELPF